MNRFRLDIYPSKNYSVWIDGLPYTAQPKKPLTLKEWAEKNGADVVYPLAVYHASSGTDRFGSIYGRTVQYVRGEGRDIGYGGTEYVLGLNPCEQMHGANSGGTHRSACAGYKTAIVSGVIVPGLDDKKKRSQNANGMMKNGDYFHLLTEDCTAETECASYMKKQGAYFMLMQDGGATTGKFMDGRLSFAPNQEGDDGRPTCSVVCIRRKPSSPPEKGEADAAEVQSGSGVLSKDAEKPKETISAEELKKSGIRYIEL